MTIESVTLKSGNGYFLSQKCEQVYHPKHLYNFTLGCIKCKSEHTVSLNGSDLYQYNQGKYIQEAFPYISQDMREMMMSGICDTCWQITFPPEDEDFNIDCLSDEELEQQGINPLLRDFSTDE